MSMSSPDRSMGAALGRPTQPSARTLSRIAGVFFVITFVTSIPALLLYEPLLKHANYILGAGADTRIQFAAFLEVILAITGIGTAVTLYPIVKRQNESIALGYVASRILESTVIVIGLVSVLSVVTLRQDIGGAAGADPATLTAVGRSLVAIHDQTFLLGPAFCAGIGNGLMLGYLMYRSGLVPRRMAMLGLYGGPLAAVTATAVLFGAYHQTSAVNSLFTLPEFAWELSLGIYLIVKGFKTPANVLDEKASAALDAGVLGPAAVAPVPAR
ncbi:MAG: hypothetical protein QOC95_1697 [Thermoleophilaceae bacterium]|nr:hypothetical protein [Thermoleophilaceae bacterium]